MRVAIATTGTMPSPADDTLLAAAFGGLGVEAVQVDWHDDAVVWSEYTACVLRSPWDYPDAAASFVAWLDAVETRTTVINPPALVRWNINKGYLSEIAAAGAAVVPTEFVPRGSNVQLTTLLESRGWADAVVKPAVGGSARGCLHLSDAGPVAGQAHLERLNAAEDVVVQVFLKSVCGIGEYSCIFFGDEFSHAVLKRPRRGGWLVQSELGGSVEPVDPPATVVETARSALAKAPSPGSFARVDLLVGSDGRPLVLELELIDPELFLGARPRAAADLAEVLLERVGVACG